MELRFAYETGDRVRVVSYNPDSAIPYDTTGHTGTVTERDTEPDDEDLVYVDLDNGHTWAFLAHELTREES